MKSLYEKKDAEYFDRIRKEILPLLPESPRNVLEIGCGAGATLAWLKHVKGYSESTGIELVERAADEARKVVDRVIVADIEKGLINLPVNHFDLVICLDVLEHLLDPWSVLGRVVEWLSDGGSLVISVPNLRYRTVIKNLLFSGEFEYENVGILDRTHLRFFTRKSAIRLMETAGLVEVRTILHPSTIKGLVSVVNMLTLGYLRDIYSWQILLSGRKVSQCDPV